jgi:hypothetical protein
LAILVDEDDGLPFLLQSPGGGILEPPGPTISTTIFGSTGALRQNNRLGGDVDRN